MKGTGEPRLPSIEDYMQDKLAHFPDNLSHNSTRQTLYYNLKSKITKHYIIFMCFLSSIVFDKNNAT